jgi:hypothetical protein
MTPNRSGLLSGFRGFVFHTVKERQQGHNTAVDQAEQPDLVIGSANSQKKNPG